MQAVLLMAGRGKRWAQSFDGPKQLMPVAGKPIVEYLLESLPDEIESFVIVVGGPHEQIVRDYFKSGEYRGRPITFVVQKEQLGLAHAYQTAKPFVKGRWFGSVCDDVFGKKGLQELFRHELSILGYRIPNPEAFGVLVTDENNYLQYAVEKPKEFISNLTNCGAMVMDESFMETQVEPSFRGEYEVPDVWTKMIKERGKKIKVVEGELWLPINDKPQFEEAVQVLENLKKNEG